MRNTLFSPVLKRNAKALLFGNLGTVFGAFLMFAICSLPVKLLIDYIPAGSIVGIVLIYLSSVLAELWTVILVAGFDLIALKLSCHQEVGVADVFYGLRSGLWKKACLLYLPAVSIFNIVFLILRFIGTKYTLMADEFINGMDMNSLLQMYAGGQIEELNAMLLPLIPVEMAFLGVGLLTLVLGVAFRVMMFPSLFLLLDYPEKSVGEIYRLNFRLLKGHFGRVLYIFLSFIPWYLLSLVTCYISFAYSYPYMQTTFAGAYLELCRFAEGNKK